MHGTATPQQLSTKGTKHVQLDPFVRPALVTAGYVVERESLFPVLCANGQWQPCRASPAFPLAPPVIVVTNMTLPQAKRVLA